MVLLLRSTLRQHLGIANIRAYFDSRAILVREIGSINGNCSCIGPVEFASV